MWKSPRGDQSYGKVAGTIFSPEATQRSSRDRSVWIATLLNIERLWWGLAWARRAIWRSGTVLSLTRQRFTGCFMSTPPQPPPSSHSDCVCLHTDADFGSGKQHPKTIFRASAWDAFNHSKQRGWKGGGGEDKEEEDEEREEVMEKDGEVEKEEVGGKKWKLEEKEKEKRELEGNLLNNKWCLIVHFSWWGEIMLSYCNLEVSRQTFSCLSQTNQLLLRRRRQTLRV